MFCIQNRGKQLLCGISVIFFQNKPAADDLRQIDQRIFLRKLKKRQRFLFTVLHQFL